MGATVDMNLIMCDSTLYTADSRYYGEKIITNDNYVIVFSDNSIFDLLIIQKGASIKITGGSTQTIANTGHLIADGSPTEGITIGSTNTTPFNLVYAGTGFHQVNYCNISYCNATPDRFYAGTNSVNGGNNTGWLFKNYLKKNTIIL